MPATPAGTVAVLRDGGAGLEVLLVRRNRRGYFADNWVFPGGQVEPVDLAAGAGDQPTARVGGEEPTDLAAARRAAVREAAEEAGLRLEASSLVAHSWWMPPPTTPHPFAAWFFLAPAPPAAAVEVDGVEIVDHLWIRPADALRRRDAGHMSLVAPTWMTLWWLGGVEDVDGALARAAAARPARFQTKMAFLEGERMALWEGDAGFVAGDPAAPGPRRRLVMSPGAWRAEVTVGAGAGDARPPAASSGGGERR